MEFKISKKAKTFTLTLMVIGLLFTGIGIAMHSSDHHFATRFLSNGLINSLFFFSIGLGALFFLALQYATETGWYAAVKRVIEFDKGIELFDEELTDISSGHVYDPRQTDHAWVEMKSSLLHIGDKSYE